jgi:hypothetical protein
MVGLAGIIFVLIPESPWWLVGKDKVDEAANILQRYNGHVKGYDVQEQIVLPHLSSLQVNHTDSDREL